MVTEVSPRGPKVLSAEEKEALYLEVIGEVKGRFEGLEKGIIVPRMATVVAALMQKMPHYFWCGFYFAEEKEMIVGPYQGTCACPNISYNGVCGTAAKSEGTLIVPNVHEFKGHIACDARSNSEIVVPVKDKRGMVIGVLDIDSTHLNAFDEIDKKYLEELMPLLLEGED
ncbi:MAG: GAF domain-containing protein [archaeon]